MEEIIKQFNLPDYIKNAKSFSEASKMIMNKFNEREDPISKRTINEIMGRLRDAQEYIKLQSEPQLKESNKYALGGMLSGISGLFKSNNIQGNQSAINGIGSGIGLAKNLASSLIPQQEANNSGTAIPYQAAPSQAGSTVSGALEGAQAGMSFGPIGAGIGALAGGIKGLFDGNAAKKKWAENSRNATAGYRNQMLNTFKMGGYIDTDNYANGGMLERDPVTGINLQAIPLSNIETIFDNELASTELQPKKDGPGFLKRLGNKANIALGDAYDAIAPITNDVGDFLKNNVDKLRYAPAAINALNYMNMEQAPETTLDRLDVRYKPQYTDEQALQNIAREQFNNTAEALSSASGGSTSALRSNILAAGLNRSRSLSNAYQRAASANRNEDRAAQQFNLGVDKANLNQSNLETDIRARDLGAFQTEKSKALSRLGQDLGNIGKEAADRNIIEKLYGYDINGKYLNKRRPKAKGIDLKSLSFKTPGINSTGLNLFK